jgi:hypothetical protein
MNDTPMSVKKAVILNDLMIKRDPGVADPKMPTTYYAKQVAEEARSRYPASVVPSAYLRNGISWPESEAAPQAPFGVDMLKVSP